MILHHSSFFRCKKHFVTMYHRRSISLFPRLLGLAFPTTTSASPTAPPIIIITQQQQQQKRNISTNRNNNHGRSGQNPTTSKNNNPFHILGIPFNSTLETAQKAFINLALQHHPDTSRSIESESNKNKNNKDDDDESSSLTTTTTQNFVEIRQAFERIRDGVAYNNKNNNRKDDDEHNKYVDQIIISWTEDDFLHWFYEQTGLKLTSDQRRELVHLYRSRIPGGKYDGPSWELARRLVAEQDAFLLRQQRQQQQQQQQRGHHSSSSSSSSFSSTSSSSSSSHHGERKTKNTNNNNNPIRRKRRR